MLDVVIRDGSIVDGSGAPPTTGDVGVRDGRIVAVGEVDEPARREIDADGCIVTPGWVDVHTHYDGQATWDDALEPSASNGVTTLVMGNCGVGFAPVRPTDHDALIDLMEGVEDIPGAALHVGMPWGSWETFAEYLDLLAGRQLRPRHRRPHRPRRPPLLRDGRAGGGQRGRHRRGPGRDDPPHRGGAPGRRPGRVHQPDDRAPLHVGRARPRHLRRPRGAAGAGRGAPAGRPRRVRGHRGRHHRLARRARRRAGHADRGGAAARRRLPPQRPSRHLHRGPAVRDPGPLAPGDRRRRRGQRRRRRPPAPDHPAVGHDHDQPRHLPPVPGPSDATEKIADLPLAERVAEMRRPEVKAAILAEASPPTSSPDLSANAHRRCSRRRCR